MAVVRLTEDYLIEHMRQTKPLSEFWDFDLDCPEPPKQAKPQAPRPAKGNPRRIRKPRLYELNGESKSVLDWALGIGVTVSALRQRLRSGETLEHALSAMKSRKAKVYNVGGVARTVKEWAKATGLKKAAIYARLMHGWSIDAAVTLPASAVLGGKAHAGGWIKSLARVGQTSGGGPRETEPKQEFFHEAAE